ncbi:hypothetical protein ACFTSF_11405 [Kribbella sp. NPDC056951]|uniref:hypothetical protein n=1 Tax=Kribbella sp. NPDC056951 TaxID=3345978 RepID=UPI003633CED0
MSEENAVSALGALYQGEKTDSIGIFNVAMVMMGIAAAYVISAVTVSDLYGTALDWKVVLLLPVPLWLIAAYHSLVALGGMSHGISLSILEYSLYLQSKLPSDGEFVEPEEPLRKYVGSRLGDRIMDIGQATWPHRIASVFVYAGFYLGIVGYTVSVIVAAWGHVSGGWSAGAIIVYSLALAIVATSWLQGFRLLNKGNRARDTWIANNKGPDLA